MDTDDLTPMAYETITLAGDVLVVLRVEVGALTIGKLTEDDFLSSVREHLQGILRFPRRYLDAWNCLDTTDIRDFKNGVEKLLCHIERTLGTPLDQRGKPPFA